MKTPMIIGIVGVIVLAVVAFMFLVPSSSTTVLAPTPDSDEARQMSDSETVQEQSSATPVVVTSPTSSPAANVSNKATVEITDTGFVPATLTVKSGTTVTFVNNGQGQHWVASEPHPVHTLLPGFDAKKALATGDSYSFTFTAAGTWGYHDHFSPSTKGTIVVE